jgi:hypothetical protein
VTGSRDLAGPAGPYRRVALAAIALKGKRHYRLETNL